MISAPGDRDSTAALATLARLGRKVVERPSASKLDSGLSLLVARVSGGKDRRLRSAVTWVLLALAAVVTVALVVVVARRHASAPEVPPLRYQVEGGRALEGGYLHDFGEPGVNVTFDDGSRVVLMPGARGRIRAAEENDARVAIDQGRASFELARREDRRWLVEAGPFTLAVKAQFFTVSWEPSMELFEVGLLRGTVSISGPVTGRDVALRSGQRLLVDLAKAEYMISEEAPDEPPP